VIERVGGQEIDDQGFPLSFDDEPAAEEAAPAEEPAASDDEPPADGEPEIPGR